MNDDWITRPFDRQVQGRLVPDTDDKIHGLRVVLELFVAAFDLDPLPPKSLRLQHDDRLWVDFAGRMNSGAESAELLAAPPFQNGLGDDATC